MSRLLKLTLASLTFLMISIAAVPSAHADPVVFNGNFDLAVPNSGTGGGWTSSGNDGAGGHRTDGGNPGGSFILNAGGAAASDPSILQLVSGFTIGQTYRLTGDFRTESGNATLVSFAIDLNGVNLQMLAAPATFIGFVHEFTAMSTSVEIRFRSEINGTDTSHRIDNIQITAVPNGAPIPEPGTMLLLGSGLAGFAMKIRRRRAHKGERS